MLFLDGQIRKLFLKDSNESGPIGISAPLPDFVVVLCSSVDPPVLGFVLEQRGSPGDLLGGEGKEASELFKVNDTVPEESFDVVVVAFERLGGFPVWFQAEIWGAFFGFPDWVRVWCGGVGEVRGSWDGVTVIAII